MRLLQMCVTAWWFASVEGHGFVKSINVDGTIYPGFYPIKDSILGIKRIAFGFSPSFENMGGEGAILNVNSPAMACNSLPATPPAMIASVRAGADIIFRWTKWLPSHRGPITTYLAPYEGDVSKVNVTQLRFFKIHEGGLYPDMDWATDKMTKANGTWKTTVPWDIKPGTYVVRHELLALHFATEHSNYAIIPGQVVSPQFYVSCYNVKVAGNGTATPADKGVSFPGAYKPLEPGIVFDIFLNNTHYPIPGPPVYKPSGVAPELKPNPPTVISATGDPAKDAEYLKAMEDELRFSEGMHDVFYKMGG